MQIPMGLGALICYVLVRLLSATSSSFSKVYQPGTYLFAIGDVLYLAVPVVMWMRFRHGQQHSLNMGIAMVAPVAAILLLGPLTAYNYLTWLITAGYPAMCLGMLIYMLFRRDYFTRQASR
jgi:hypothetical protein